MYIWSLYLVTADGNKWSAFTLTSGLQLVSLIVISNSSCFYYTSPQQNINFKEIEGDGLLMLEAFSRAIPILLCGHKI